MTWQDVIALSVAAVAVVFVLRFLWQTMGSTTSCAKGCGCSGSPAPDDNGSEARSLRRIPLVTVGSPKRDPDSSDKPLPKAP